MRSKKRVWKNMICWLTFDAKMGGLKLLKRFSHYTCCKFGDLGGQVNLSKKRCPKSSKIHENRGQGRPGTIAKTTFVNFWWGWKWCVFFMWCSGSKLVNQAAGRPRGAKVSLGLVQGSACQSRGSLSSTIYQRKNSVLGNLSCKTRCQALTRPGLVAQRIYIYKYGYRQLKVTVRERERTDRIHEAERYHLAPFLGHYRRGWLGRLCDAAHGRVKENTLLMYLWAIASSVDI